MSPDRESGDGSNDISTGSVAIAAANAAFPADVAHSCGCDPGITSTCQSGAREVLYPSGLHTVIGDRAFQPNVRTALSGHGAAEERTALADLDHRTIQARRAIADYLAWDRGMLDLILQGPPWSRVQQRVFSSKDAALEAVLTTANQWYVAMNSPHLPTAIRRRLTGRTDRDLRDRIHHCRNIREHWQTTRPYFSDFSVRVPASRDLRSVRWYRERFPDKTPWSSSYSNIDGHTIAGIVSLDALSEEVEIVSQLVDEVVAERTG
jgi:hypothetical protein